MRFFSGVCGVMASLRLVVNEPVSLLGSHFLAKCSDKLVSSFVDGVLSVLMCC